MKDYKGFTLKEFIDDAKLHGIIIDSYNESYFRAYEDTIELITLYRRENQPKKHMFGIVTSVVQNPINYDYDNCEMHVDVYYRAIGMPLFMLIASELFASDGQTKFILKRDTKNHQIKINFDIERGTEYKTIIEKVKTILEYHNVPPSQASSVNNISFMNIGEDGTNTRYAIIEKVLY